MVLSLLTGRCYEAEICANLLLLRCAFVFFAELKFFSYCSCTNLREKSIHFQLCDSATCINSIITVTLVTVRATSECYVAL